MGRERVKVTGRRVLNRDRYIPGHLLKLANGMSRSASRVYLALFGVGVIEWRILSILSIESYVTAQSICEEIGLDRAAASRSLRELVKRGMVKITGDANDNRKRPLAITEEGKVLHDRMLAIATRRQKLLTRGFSEEEIDQVLGLLGRLGENLDAVYNHDEHLIARFTKQSQSDSEASDGRKSKSGGVRRRVAGLPSDAT